MLCTCLIKDVHAENTALFVLGSVGGFCLIFFNLKYEARDFPGGAVVKNLPANTGDMGLSPGLGRSHMPRSN